MGRARCPNCNDIVTLVETGSQYTTFDIDHTTGGDYDSLDSEFCADDSPSTFLCSGCGNAWSTMHHFRYALRIAEGCVESGHG